MNRGDGGTRKLLGLLGTVLAPLTLALQRSRESGVILLYHRVSPEADRVYQPISPDELVAHFEVIEERFTVLSLAEMVERLRAGKSLRGCCGITFDDGYRDFLEHAYPVLRDFRFPSTHFLVTDCIDTNRPPWTYRLNQLLDRRVVTGAPDLGPLTAAEREGWMARSWTQDQSPTHAPPMLRPEDLTSIDPRWVEWGSHTVTHGFLDRVPVEERTRELVDSKRRLEQLTGRDVRWLSYPNGHYDEGTVKAAREAGYQGALAVGNKEVTSTSDPFRLPRFDVSRHPRAMLTLEVSGAVQRLRRLFA